MLTRTLPLLAALTLLALTGCATAAAPTEAASSALAELGEITLVQSKAPTQLLRNEAAARVPEIVVQDVAETTDSSASCLDTGVDPDGLARQWTSTATFLVTNSQAARVATVTEDVAATFSEQGWSAELDGAATTLTSETSPVVIHLEAVAKENGEHAEIRITTTGQCVRTEGPESDEVLELENAS